jgi:hypothetical protein
LHKHAIVQAIAGFEITQADFPVHDGREVRSAGIIVFAGVHDFLGPLEHHVV